MIISNLRINYIDIYSYLHCLLLIGRITMLLIIGMMFSTVSSMYLFTFSVFIMLPAAEAGFAPGFVNTPIVYSVDYIRLAS